MSNSNRLFSCWILVACSSIASAQDHSIAANEGIDDEWERHCRVLRHVDQQESLLRMLAKEEMSSDDFHFTNPPWFETTNTPHPRWHRIWKQARSDSNSYQFQSGALVRSSNRDGVRITVRGRVNSNRAGKSSTWDVSAIEIRDRGRKRVFSGLAVVPEEHRDRAERLIRLGVPPGLAA